MLNFVRFISTVPDGVCDSKRQTRHDKERELEERTKENEMHVQ